MWSRTGGCERIGSNCHSRVTSSGFHECCSSIRLVFISVPEYRNTTTTTTTSFRNSAMEHSCGKTGSYCTIILSSNKSNNLSAKMPHYSQFFFLKNHFVTD